MSSQPTALPAERPWTLPSRGRVGMLSLIAGESAIFVIFLIAYIFYIGKSLSGPTPQQVLEIPVFITVCLLSSSLTIHFAVRALHHGQMAIFKILWFVTLALGAIFLIGTGLEWRHLICDDGLTVSTNLFGTTFYSLVGLHGFHVIVGLLIITIVMLLALFAKVKQEHAERLDVFSLYWHFVDVVWVFVFSVVYIIGR
jgi:cytochrome c oxidase subunit III